MPLPTCSVSLPVSECPFSAKTGIHQTKKSAPSVLPIKRIGNFDYTFLVVVERLHEPSVCPRCRNNVQPPAPKTLWTANLEIAVCPRPVTDQTDNSDSTKWAGHKPGGARPNPRAIQRVLMAAEPN